MHGDWMKETTEPVSESMVIKLGGYTVPTRN